MRHRGYAVDSQQVLEVDWALGDDVAVGTAVNAPLTASAAEGDAAKAGISVDAARCTA